MNQPNQYQAPQSNVEVADPAEFSKIRILGTSGRIGRVRYLAYNFGFFGIAFLAYLLVGMIGAFFPSSAGGIIVGLFMLLLSIVAIVVNFLFAIQRSHDFNVTGWLSLITLVPFGFLVFLFVPGTNGENGYGNPPPPNNTGVIITAVLAPFIFIFLIGVLAAIAVPAYNSYVERAKQAQQIQQ